MDSLYKLSACTVIDKLKTDEVSIHDVLNCLEKRIENVDNTVNSLPILCFDRARRKADELQKLPAAQRGPLCGLPITIKDLTAVKNVRTTFGSMVYEHHIPSESDQLVENIERSGGIVYAKSNTPEFGTGGITFNDVFGITCSPRNVNFASGGSSGGAAASLASGCAWMSHGSDMAGSLRTPAAFCGVTSLRPSPGKIKSDSEFTPFDILGAEGPMARSVNDLALFADVMFADENMSLLKASFEPVMPAKVAVSSNLGITQVSHDIETEFQKFTEFLAGHCQQITTDHPDFSDIHHCFDVLRAHSYALGLEDTLKDHAEKLKPEVVWNIESGLSLTTSQLRQATRQQGQIINRAAQFMQHVDVLICPATSVTSVDAQLRYPGSDTVPVPQYYRWLAIAYAVTVSALPVLTLPVAMTANGMPFAVQLIGKPGGELKLFQYAQKLYELCEWTVDSVDPVGAV